MEDDGDFPPAGDDYDSEEEIVEKKVSRFARLGGQALDSILASAQEDRKKSKRFSKSLIQEFNAPGSEALAHTWINRFNQFLSHTLKRQVLDVPPSVYLQLTLRVVMGGRQPGRTSKDFLRLSLITWKEGLPHPSQAASCPRSHKSTIQDLQARSCQISRQLSLVSGASSTTASSVTGTSDSVAMKTRGSVRFPYSQHLQRFSN